MSGNRCEFRDRGARLDSLDTLRGVSSLSDPNRATRRDRRRAQKAINEAHGAGRLTAADRALRSERVAAAHTVGDLLMLTRDLNSIPGGAVGADGAVSRSLGSAIDPAVLESMRVHPTPTDSSAATVRPVTMPPALRRLVIIAVASVAGLILLCGLGLIGIVISSVGGSDGDQGDPSAAPTSITTGVDEKVAPVAPSASLHSAAGWRMLVTAVRAESGTAEVYDAVIYPDYAVVGLVADQGTEQRVFRDGAFLDSVRVQSPAAGQRVDLAAIDPAVIARLPQLTAERLGDDKPTSVYMIISALATDPQISVYVQGEGGAQYRTYGLDGRPLS
jgi:hypothetical protein